MVEVPYVTITLVLDYLLDVLIYVVGSKVDGTRTTSRHRWRVAVDFSETSGVVGQHHDVWGT